MEQPRNSKPNPDRWDVDKVRFQLDKPLSPNRDILGIGEIMKDVVEGLEQPVQDNILLLRKVWPELVGGPIASHSAPSFIKDFTLHVFVDHPGWMPELERTKRLLLKKLQASYREMRIRRLTFILEQK